LSRNT
ncbi:hypothetical protein VTL71DRAFT_7068, partial [Oculimacula yallundae]